MDAAYEYAGITKPQIHTESFDDEFDLENSGQSYGLSSPVMGSPRLASPSSPLPTSSPLASEAGGTTSLPDGDMQSTGNDSEGMHNNGAHSCRFFPSQKLTHMF